jgi:outer membrane receptor protein involved in Fe transport
MKIRLLLILFALIIGTAFVFGDLAIVIAQETANSEFTLEEITVTAEKRAVNIQTVASSITAIEASDLMEQGKITAAEILESVPNLTYRGDTNITIRGVKKTQEAGGGSPVPNATATYVDDIYEGIGGTYDINRVEVLRGPQGTLYGRSATGGVVAFHTNDPKLGKFSADMSNEYGTKSRMNFETAINVPVGDTVALRVAAHYLHQAEGYYNGAGGETETKEGRLKALFQPTDKLGFILSLSASRVQNAAGGWSQGLESPDKINYYASYTAPSKSVPTKKAQEALHVNYDLGGSALTYIAAMYQSDNRGKSGVGLNRSSYQWSVVSGKPTKTQTHEIRWASGDDFPLKWLTMLVGGNYYKNDYNINGESWQASDLSSTDPATYNAPLFTQHNKGSIVDFGIFTEETFKVNDVTRVTAGLRYDKLKIKNYSGYDFNGNLAPGMVGLNPPHWLYYPSQGQYDLDAPDFGNVTYKLRFEYDLTPENMVYAMTSTGFLPGNSEVNIGTIFSPPPDMQLLNIVFIKLPFDQEKLTAYEVGTKNRFLDKKMQLNSSVFYYDYAGYQEAININPPGSPPPPNFVVVRVPVKMIGFEVDFSYLLTQYDKVTLSGGYLDATLKSYPNVPGTTTSAKSYMYLKDVPGLPTKSATLGYDHTFMFENGASLVPRAELRYTGGYYLSQLSSAEAASKDASGNSYLDYLYQGSVVLGNVAATFTSPDSKYSATVYVRNVTDKRYKTSATLPTGTALTNVTVGDPRTWGVSFSAKF